MGKEHLTIMKSASKLYELYILSQLDFKKVSVDVIFKSLMLTVGTI